MKFLDDQIVLNFLSISHGGGLQNALSFVHSLASLDITKETFFAVLKESSPLVGMCRANGIKLRSVKSGYYNRIKFELQSKNLFLKNQICFTHFGLPMLRSSGHCLNVVGCAYSNLFYPEIPFWSYLPRRERYRRYAIDEYRRLMLTKADYWIFETETLRRRAVEICGFPPHRVSVVKMAPSELVSPQKIIDEIRERFDSILPQVFRFLILSGAHPNKRIHLLGKVADHMRKRGVREFVFVSTMDEKHPYTHIVRQSFIDHGAGDYIVNLGPITPDNVASLIDVCHAMGNFSVLESFSNNFVEAWRMGKPLVVTDADWARDSCGNAAIFVDVEDAEETADMLIQLKNDAQLRESLVASGYEQLRSFLTPERKTRAYLDVIQRAKGMGFCSASERSTIHWPRNFYK